MERKKRIENLEWEFEDLNEKCNECYASACDSESCNRCPTNERLDEIHAELIVIQKIAKNNRK